MNKYKVNMLKFFLWLILISSCGFFRLFKTDKYIYITDLCNLASISISIIILIYFNFKPLFIKSKFKKILIFTIFMYFVKVVYSTMLYSKYSQTFIDTISCSFDSLTILVFFICCFLQDRIQDKNYLKNAIKKVGMICAILSIIQVFLYKYNIVFLDIGTPNIRYNSLRYCLGASLLPFAFFIAVFDYINYKNKWDLIIVIIEMFCFVYASKSRTMIMYMMIVFYIIVILFLKKKYIKYLMITLGIFFIGFGVFSGFFNKYILEISSDVGVNMRFETINYYMEQFYEKPILGNGFIKQFIDTKLDIILKGKQGYYYRDDVGIIGLLNEKGIIGLLIYLIYLIISIKMIKCLYKKDKNKYVWLLAIWLYILISSINLIYTNPQRILVLMIILSLIDNYYKEGEKIK